MTDAPSNSQGHDRPCIWSCRWARKMLSMDEFEPFTPRIECRNARSGSFGYLLDSRSLVDGCRGFEPAEAVLDAPPQQGKSND